MTFKIKITYQTGDSFGTHVEEDVLEYEWESIDYAKDSLRRIKEHYEWNQKRSYNDSLITDKNRPSWHNPKGYHPSRSMDRSVIPSIINLDIDENTEIQFPAMWLGYFERLIRCQIVCEGDDMSFDF